MIDKWPDNSPESFKQEILQVFDFLDDEVEMTFKLRQRKEYYLSNLSQWNEGMQSIKNRNDNLGVVDEQAEDQFDALQQDFKSTLETIEEITPDEELNIYQISQMIRGRFGDSLAQQIPTTLDLGFTTWESFIQWLNLALKQDPFYWDALRDKLQ